MKKQKVAQDNMGFILATVGLSFVSEFFAQAVWDSSLVSSQFPTDNVGKPGYVRIDSSALRKTEPEKWSEFRSKIEEGILKKIAYSFSSQTEFEGDLAERTVVKKDGYVFSFHVKQYERDSEHGYEIIEPDKLADVPEDEELGRVVYLTITYDDA